MLLEGYPSAVNLGSGSIDAYMRATADCSVAAVKRAVDRFLRGEVPDFPKGKIPTAPEFAEQARLFRTVEAIENRDNVIALPKVEHGMIDADYGSGRVRLAELTWAEVQIVEKQKGRTADGRSMAGMTAEQIREAINQPKLPMPTPRLQKMGS